MKLFLYIVFILAVGAILGSLHVPFIVLFVVGMILGFPLAGLIISRVK